MNVRFAAFLAAVAVAASSADALSSPDSLPHPVPSKVPTIHPGVHRALRTDGKVDLILELTQTTESTLENIKESAFSSREAKLLAVTDKLQTQNKVAAAEVTKLLSQEAGGLHEGFKNFWISNVVFVSGATFEMVEKLAGLASVGNIREQKTIKLDEPKSVKELVGQEWGVKKISAPKVWADGNIGQGVIVSSLDTGVHGTHEALKRNFRGAYGWYDPQEKSTEPNDPAGHGTHTMGTIAGAKGVGVAPGATWMSCKMSLDEFGYIYESNIVDCAQWILCPTDTQGENADCAKAPHVVNNSWGGPGGDNWFKAAVDAWVKAGIIPVFSAGNSGDEGCATAGSPGDYPNVIGVGATDIDDALAWFSSKGPTLSGRRKPDISAPGDFVRSSVPTSDTDYDVYSGTSMAAPHVTGAIALLLSAQPDLAIDEVKIALYTTTDQVGLPASNYTCGGTSDKVWPNNQFGHGRLNVLNAYEGFRPAP